MPWTGPSNSPPRFYGGSEAGYPLASRGSIAARGGRSARLARAAAALLLTLLAFAVFAPMAAAEVQVEVRKIYATTERKFVDPKLQDLESHFGRFGMFTSFTAEDTAELKFAEEGETHTVAMPDGKELKLVYRGESKGYLKLRFELGDMKMNVRIHDGGLFFHSGVPHRKGRVVLAIKATTKK